MGISPDGLHFRATQKTFNILDENGNKVDTRYSSDYRISQAGKEYILLYRYTLNNKSELCLATSKNTETWNKKATLTNFSAPGMIAPSFMFERKRALYHGQGDISLALSADLVSWKNRDKPVLTPREKFFDNHGLMLCSVIDTTKGILVLYYVKKRLREGDIYTLGAALFDKKYPSRVTWRSDKPIWEQNDFWQGKDVYPMGAAVIKEKLYLYFGVEGEAVYAVQLGSLYNLFNEKQSNAIPKLQKHPDNPIITPVLKHVWEANATFNTAAIHEDGKVHFVYRAMGPHNTSVLGYASSSDGIHIDERLDDPIYYPTEPFEVPVGLPSINYMSGGGYGGCEDPRITRIEDTLYMTYVAYNGQDAPKVALTSIKLDDFLQKRWIWAKPKIISSPHVVNKNCVIFPEKVRGKFVVMHRVFPNILIDMVNDLTFENFYLTGHYSITPREDSWDSRKLGAGAPPIKTDDGWLLIYQAVDDRDPGRYKIGAMLLDLEDPTKILYRPDYPILEPTEWYENEGFKSGVAYPCGAVIKNDQLYVYYGGADTVICVASTPLKPFLHQLKKACKNKKEQLPKLQPIQHFLYAQ